MTAVNILTHFDIAGRVLFNPLCSPYTDTGTPPANRTMRDRSDAEAIVIQWWDITAQRNEQSETICGFWQRHTLDELAVAQNTPEQSSLDGIGGIWPEEHREDGFENALRQWRDQDMERHG